MEYSSDRFVDTYNCFLKQSLILFVNQVPRFQHKREVWALLVNQNNLIFLKLVCHIVFLQTKVNEALFYCVISYYLDQFPFLLWTYEQCNCLLWTKEQSTT